MVGLDRAAAAVARDPGSIGPQTPIGQKAFGTGVSNEGVATPFSSVFKSMVAQTSELGKQAQNAVTGLLSGQGVEIHDVMIASQKANASFELAMQVRNKAVGAYQQLMGMQF